MLTILKNTSNGMEEIPELMDNSWIRAIDPSPGEMQFICNRLAVPHDYLASSLDPDERSHLERDGDVMLIVLRIPRFQGKDADIPYVTVPFGIILTPTQIATVCKADSPITRDILLERRRSVTTGKRFRFILFILLNIAKEYLKSVQAINAQVDILEERLKISQRNEELLEILKYQKSLVYFTTALRSNELTIDRLEKSGMFRTYPDDADLLEDVQVEIRQAIEMVEISNNILSQMMDAFASIISNNLNVVMKVLALVTIVLSVPTLVASFYGMNVMLPFQDTAVAFLIVLGISFALSFSMIYFFWRKRWF